MYSSIESAQSHREHRINTNPRYSNFKQSHFTAGDEEQFESSRNKSLSKPDIPKQCLSVSVELPNQIRWTGYTNVQSKHVRQTFEYLFHKFKKGIFVQIRDNKVSVFLPFSKHNFVNEWGNRLKFDTKKYSSWNDLFKCVTENDNYRFNPSNVQWDCSKWYANNGLIRYENPIAENDSGVSTMKHMFEEVCKHRSVPDMEFFVNRRDFPLLTRDYTEPYTALWGKHTPLVSHSYDKYLPILSMCSTSIHADVPIPNWGDWSRVMRDEHVFFPKIDYAVVPSESIPWDNKKRIAVFRGSSTGLGTTVETNPRLRVASMSCEKIRDSDGLILLDAGITKWKSRPRTISNSTFVDTMCETLPLVPSMTFTEQLSYRYIVHIDGNVSAFRLSRELASDSVVLIVRSDYSMWYSHLLVPYTHYVPIKHDCSDLYEQIKWCKTNDDLCKKIVHNANEFSNKYLSKNGMMDYIQTVLVKLKTRMGNYRYKIPTVTELQEVHQREWIDSHCAKLEKHLQKSSLPSTLRFPEGYPHRCVDLLRGMQWFMTLHSSYLKSLPDTFKKNHYRIDSHSFVTVDVTNVMQRVHTAFVGMACVNTLLDSMPNFQYTFGVFDEKIALEYIPNTTPLLSYLQDPMFSFDRYLDIVLNVALVLHEAYERLGFIHGNLNVSNIIIETHSSQRTYTYTYTSNQNVRIQTFKCPVLVNYASSQCVIDSIRHGHRNPFKLPTHDDISTFLYSTIPIIIKSHCLDKRSLHRIFLLSSFISPKDNFSSVSDLKQFFKNPLPETTHKPPFKFIEFLQSTIGIQLSLTPYNNYSNRYGSAHHVFTCLTANQTRIPNVSYANLQNLDLEQLLHLYVRCFILKRSFPELSIDSYCSDMKLCIESSIEDLKREWEKNLVPVQDMHVTLDMFENTNEIDELCKLGSKFSITRDWNQLKWKLLEYASVVKTHRVVPLFITRMKYNTRAVATIQTLDLYK